MTVCYVLPLLVGGCNARWLRDLRAEAIRPNIPVSDKRISQSEPTSFARLLEASQPPMHNIARSLNRPESRTSLAAIRYPLSAIHHGAPHPDRNPCASDTVNKLQVSS